MTISVAHTTTAFAATITIPSTTAGNCLIVCVCSDNNTAAITGMTLGGSAGNFGQLISPVVGVNETVNIWADPNCAGGQTSVVISGTNLGLGSVDGGVTIYEVSGLVATLAALLDKSSSGTGIGNFSSGTTATTTQASEIWIGANLNFGGSITGPGVPWANVTPTGDCITGYQIVSSTGTATYSGSGGGGYAAAVVTLKAAAAAAAAPGMLMAGII